MIDCEFYSEATVSNLVLESADTLPTLLADTDANSFWTPSVTGCKSLASHC